MPLSLEVALIFALGTAFFLGKSRWNYTRLPLLPVQGADLDRNVTVIIPARDEERNIERAVGSFHGARVLVVDDGSTDRTAERARTAGAEVISAPPLPPGWLGKPHACWTGAQQCGTEWILFVDADTWFDRNFLASLVKYAGEQQLEMVSVFPEQTRRSVFERILTPYAFGLYFCGVSASSVNQHGKGEALANGQCILIRRETYFRIGGHAQVASSIIEDVDLAAVAKSEQLKLRIIRAENMAHARPYGNLRAILRGFEKNSFRFLIANPAGGVQVIFVSMLLLCHLPLLFFLGAQEQWLALAAIAILPSVLFAPWYGSIVEAAVVPLAIYLFHLIVMSSMFNSLPGRKAVWKGRAV
jgi:4,4'-diaponeurosporenoate glycosyltransferase